MKLYHSTKNKNVKNILKNGLLKKYSEFWKGMGGCLYLSNKPNWMSQDKNYTILEIHINKKQYSKLNKISEWEYILWQDIKPKYIKVKKVCEKNGKK